MTVTVLIPTPLRPYAKKNALLILQGKTVGEILDRLVNEHALLRIHLYAEDGKLRKFVNVYINNDDIRYLQNENTPVTDKDTISIIPSIAGG